MKKLFLYLLLLSCCFQNVFAAYRNRSLKQRRNAFLEAIQEEDCERIAQMASDDGDLLNCEWEIKKGVYSSPLLYAIVSGKVHAVAALLEAGMTPDIDLNDTCTMLMVNQISDRLVKRKIMCLLYDMSLDRDALVWSYYMSVLPHNDLESIEDLIDLDPSMVSKIFVVDGIPCTMLHVAACDDNIDVVRKLVGLGADVNTLIFPEGVSFGRSPLHYAVAFAEAGVINFLLSCGAQSNWEIFNIACKRSFSPAMLFALSDGLDKAIHDVNGFVLS